MNATGSTSNATNILLSLGMTTDSGLSGLGGETESSGFSSLLSQLLPGNTQGQSALLLPGTAGVQTLPPEQQTLPLTMPPVLMEEAADVNDLLGQIGIGLEMAAQVADDASSLQGLAGNLKALAVAAGEQDDTTDTSDNPDAEASAALMLFSVPVQPELTKTADADGAARQMDDLIRQGTVPPPLASAAQGKPDRAKSAGAETLTTAYSAITPEDAGSGAEGADFLLPGEERILAPGTQGLSLQGQQPLTVQNPAAANAMTPSATIAVAPAISADDSGDASSFVSDSSGDTLTDAELQAQRLQVSKDKLEFGQDRREWGGALGARIMTMVAEDVQKARIQLDPPELGSLEIKLHISQDQASVQVQAQHAHVRDVLEANAHRLRDALASQGITLSGFDVSERGQGDGSSGQSGDGQGSQTTGDDWFAEDVTAENKPQPQVSSNNLLDTFA